LISCRNSHAIFVCVDAFLLIARKTITKLASKFWSQLTIIVLVANTISVEINSSSCRREI
jgi:hypothetical protein